MIYGCARGHALSGLSDLGTRCLRITARVNTGCRCRQIRKFGVGITLFVKDVDFEGYRSKELHKSKSVGTLDSKIICLIKIRTDGRQTDRQTDGNVSARLIHRTFVRKLYFGRFFLTRCPDPRTSAFFADRVNPRRRYRKRHWALSVHKATEY